MMLLCFSSQTNMPNKEISQKTLLADINSIMRKSFRHRIPDDGAIKLIIKKLILKGYTKQMLKRGLSTITLLKALREEDLLRGDW